MGLSQIHGDREGRAASLVHNDLNLENLVLVKTSTIKFNDFNIAVMNRQHRDTEKPCGHPVLFESPLWRSPEEIRDDGTYVSEKKFKDKYPIREQGIKNYIINCQQDGDTDHFQAIIVNAYLLATLPYLRRMGFYLVLYELLH